MEARNFIMAALAVRTKRSNRSSEQKGQSEEVEAGNRMRSQRYLARRRSITEHGRDLVSSLGGDGKNFAHQLFE